MLHHLVYLLSHARLASNLLPLPLAKKINTAHQVAWHALMLADSVYEDDKSNADYVNLYYEVVPEALTTLEDLAGLVRAEGSE